MHCSKHSCPNKGCQSAKADCQKHKCKVVGCVEMPVSGGAYCEGHKCRVSTCSHVRPLERVDKKIQRFCDGHNCLFCVFGEQQSFPCAIHMCLAPGCGLPKAECNNHKCQMDGCVEMRASQGVYCKDHKCPVYGCVISKAECKEHWCQADGCEARSWGLAFCWTHNCEIMGCRSRRVNDDRFCEQHRCVSCDDPCVHRCAEPYFDTNGVRHQGFCGNTPCDGHVYCESHASFWSGFDEASSEDKQEFLDLLIKKEGSGDMYCYDVHTPKLFSNVLRDMRVEPTLIKGLLDRATAIVQGINENRQPVKDGKDFFPDGIPNLLCDHCRSRSGCCEEWELSLTGGCDHMVGKFPVPKVSNMPDILLHWKTHGSVVIGGSGHTITETEYNIFREEEWRWQFSFNDDGRPVLQFVTC